MTTNTQIITKALQEIGVLQEGQVPTSTQSNDALDIMNHMVTQWKIKDIDLSYPPQDTAAATFPLPIWAERAVVTNLAVELAPSYKKGVSQILAIKADDSLNAVAIYVMNNNLQPSDMSHLPQGSVKTRYNIETDT